MFNLVAHVVASFPALARSPGCGPSIPTVVADAAFSIAVASGIARPHPHLAAAAAAACIAGTPSVAAVPARCSGKGCWGCCESRTVARGWGRARPLRASRRSILRRCRFRSPARARGRSNRPARSAVSRCDGGDAATRNVPESDSCLRLW